MQTVCEKNMCTGCMACMAVCAYGALEIKAGYRTYNMIIHEDKCKKCGACKKVCQNNTKPELIEPISWLEGWAKDKEIRRTSSSGGFASALMKSFIETGGVVCSCVFENGKFIFKFARNVNEIQQFQGSKYVKSNLAGMYREIKSIAKKEKVLFIGLPCQVAALKNYLPERLNGNVYMVDLICHGTPSPLLLNKFLNEHGYDIKELSDIHFRRKGDFRLTDDQWKPIIDSSIADRYSYSFLHSFNYTENCYSCQYAKRQRVSDVTLGDSWGTDRKEEKKNGISLALVQTESGNKLLEMSDLILYNVDQEKAVAFNHQLVTPSVKDKKWIRFFKAVNCGMDYDKAVLYATPYGVLKQDVKKIYLRLRKNPEWVLDRD